MYVSPSLSRKRDIISEDSPSAHSYKETTRDETSSTDEVYLTTNVFSGIKRTFIHGHDTPRFHERVRLGELIPHTPFKSFTKDLSMSGGIDVHYHRSSNGHDYRQFSEGSRGFYSLDGQITESSLAALVPTNIGKYVQTAAAKIYGSGFDALTFIAELSEIKSLFSGAIWRLLRRPASSIRTLKQLGLRSRDIPKHFRTLSNEYLSVRYGWRPLFNDMFSILKLVETYNDKTKTRIRARSGNPMSVSNDTAINESEFEFYLRTVERNTKTEISVNAHVVADIEVPKLQFNLIQTGWEVIPLSFVIDWFVTVGKSISAASFLMHQSQYVASYGYKIKQSITENQYISGTKSGFISGYDKHTIAGSATLKVRVPAPVPLTPSITVNLNTYKILDLVALMVQRFRRI